MSTIEPLPTFSLFPNPERENVFEHSTESCDLCGKKRGVIYTAGYLSPSEEMEELTICPWCIADGTAGAKGIEFNDSTIYPANESTPQMSDADQELVGQRTPGFVAWQGNHWLMCCGRACVYLGEAHRGDLQGRWASAVKGIFADSDFPQEEIDEIVADIGEGNPCAYVFQCQICKGLNGFWDSD